MKKVLKQVLLTVIVVIVVLVVFSVVNGIVGEKSKLKDFHEKYQNGRTELIAGETYQFSDDFDITIHDITLELADRGEMCYIVNLHFDMINHSDESVDKDDVVSWKDELGEVSVLAGAVENKYGIGISDIYNSNGEQVEVFGPGTTKDCYAVISQFMEDHVEKSRELYDPAEILGYIRLGGTEYYIEFGEMLDAE